MRMRINKIYTLGEKKIFRKINQSGRLYPNSSIYFGNIQHCLFRYCDLRICKKYSFSQSSDVLEN